MYTYSVMFLSQFHGNRNKIFSAFKYAKKTEGKLQEPTTDMVCLVSLKDENSNS